MKIGLIDVDSLHFPNLALMKIAAWHKQQGDSVEWVNYLQAYDRVYKSKIFTFTPDDCNSLNTSEIIRGGTGYNLYNELPPSIDAISPDYSIYPQYPHAYGFTTRGCPNTCKWCIVPVKEGYIRPYKEVESIIAGRKSLILMDNNILSIEHGIKQLEKLTRLKVKVDINQGLDARIIARDTHIAKILSKIHWLRYIRLACDTSSQLPHIIRAIHQLRHNGILPYRIFCYCLVTTDIQDAHYRITQLMKLGIVPFAQPYRDFTRYNHTTQAQKDLAHWCNRKHICNSTTFPDFQPRKGFFCRQYLTTEK